MSGFQIFKEVLSGLNHLLLVFKRRKARSLSQALF